MAYNNLQNFGTSPSKNLILAGDFSTNPKQRGSSFFVISASQHTLDGWYWNQTGPGTMQLNSGASLVSPPNSKTSFLRSNMQVTVGVTDSPLANNALYAHSTAIEGYDFVEIAERKFNLSFWVFCTVPGTYCVTLTNGAHDLHYTREYTIDAPSTLQFISMELGPTPGGSWQYTTSTGLRIYFILAAGSDYYTAPDVWKFSVGADSLSTSNQTNLFATGSAVFQLYQVQVTPGPNPVPYLYETPQESLTRCQRYYCKTFPLATPPAQNTGSASGALLYSTFQSGVGQSGIMWRFPVNLRIDSPTVTFYNPNATNGNWRNSTLNADSGVASASLGNSSGLIVGNSGVGGDLAGNYMAVHATADASLT